MRPVGIKVNGRIQWCASWWSIPLGVNFFLRIMVVLGPILVLGGDLLEMAFESVSPWVNPDELT